MSHHEYKNCNGDFHREFDLPAIEHRNGTKEWWNNGRRYRADDLPSIEYANGDKWWCVNGKFDRQDGLPVIEYANGKKEWKRRGKFMSEIQVKMDDVFIQLLGMKITINP